MLVLWSLIGSPPQKQATTGKAKEAGAPASIPIFPNASCPIMGKPVSTKLFAETEKGRIYICCKSCIKDILADVETAHRTAYPVLKKADNKACPITSKQIDQNPPTVTLQGFEIALCCDDCAAELRDESQIVLAKLNDPELVDLENETCPVTGEPTTKNSFVVIEGTIVRLSSPKFLDEICKDPAKVLSKAKQIRAQEDEDRSKEQSGEPRRD
jgi:hypothetical protein